MSRQDRISLVETVAKILTVDRLTTTVMFSIGQTNKQTNKQIGVDNDRVVGFRINHWIYWRLTTTNLVFSIG